MRLSVNKGGLCIKGWTAPATLAHPDRLLTPLARQPDGELAPVTWDEALNRIVRAFQDAQRRYGRDAVGVFGGGSLTNEKTYLLVSSPALLWALRTSTTMAAFVCPRQLLPLSRRWALIVDCPSRWRYAQAEVIMLVGRISPRRCPR